MKQYDIGIDLGTTSIIIATEEQGVVFRQPTIGAVDTRTNSILAVGDEALKMVGRAPAHIDLVRPLRDGIIQDHRMTNELIVRFVNQVCRSRIFKPRIAVCVPAAITGIDQTQYEAAAIDGASKWQQILHVTLPNLRTMIAILFILNVGKIFNADFGLFWNVPMQNGALFSVTQVIDTYIYRVLMNTGNIGQSTAAGLLQNIVGFICIIGANAVVKKIDSDSTLF